MEKPKILIADDDPRMRELVRLQLQREFTFIEAEDGLSALKALKAAKPDLILLDVLLPELDGLETLVRIREMSNVPVIILTGISDVSVRVGALEAGADDYMVKPVDGRELMARILSVLRRSAGGANPHAVIQRRSLVIHPEARECTWKGHPLSLTPKEFDLLTLLAANPDEVFSRQRLLDRIWNGARDCDTRTVDSHVKNLRRALGDGADMIVTVWGVGYRCLGA